MNKLFNFLIVTATILGLVTILYIDGYLDNTPFYDVIYEIVHFNEQKISSPLISGNSINFYGKETLSAECSGSSVIVRGVVDSNSRRNIVFQFTDGTNGDRELSQSSISVSPGKEFSKTLRIPDTTSDIVELTVYTNDKSQGMFKGWISDYLFFERVGGQWRVMKSPVFEENLAKYTVAKGATASLKATKNIQSDNAVIKAKALDVTQGCTTDYERVLAIHDFICQSMYYDEDKAASDRIGIDDAADMLNSRKGICSGFANLYAAMCRSIDIPCVVVTGYALGISDNSSVWTESSLENKSPNHAWNEVYADGRWIIVDTTWDCLNTYKNGSIDEEEMFRRVYFDANLEYFSQNHRIMKYKDI